MLPLFWIWFQFRWPKGRFNLRKVFFCLINSVFANFVCAEFLINGGDCSKDVRNGGWSVGRRGNRGETLCKIQQVFQQNTHTNCFFLQTKHTQKKLLNKTCKNRRKKKGEQRGDALQNTTICEQNIQKLWFVRQNTPNKTSFQQYTHHTRIF